jgi:hypothetical protein
METPILFLIFNRPDKTKLVFERIRESRPKYFYIAADGPRSLSESVLCEQTRALIINKIDWPCEVHTLFRENNLGCTNAVTSAISWFFEQVESGIILEDDCLPDPSFFAYCAELLEKYASENSIKHIAGSNFIFDKQIGTASYYFSSISICWGWATWRRAWKEFELNTVEEISEEKYIEALHFPNFIKRHTAYWKKQFDYHRKGEDNIWDYRWLFNLWFNKGLAINPNKNLVKNIGYGADATTSTGQNEKRNVLANLKTASIQSIVHPSTIFINIEADSLLCNVFNPPPPISKRIRHEIGKLLPESIKSIVRKR